MQTQYPNAYPNGKHTPGPWRVRGAIMYAGFGISDSAGKSLAAFPSTMRRDPAERVANAKLIAAAPDMLAALALLVSVARQNAGRVEYENVRDAEQIIAKARGEA